MIMRNKMFAILMFRHVCTARATFNHISPMKIISPLIFIGISRLKTDNFTGISAVVLMHFRLLWCSIFMIKQLISFYNSFGATVDVQIDRGGLIFHMFVRLRWTEMLHDGWVSGRGVMVGKTKVTIQIIIPRVTRFPGVPQPSIRVDHRIFLNGKVDCKLQ